MTLLQQIGSWFRRQATSVSRIFSFGTTEVYSDISQQTAISKGFNSNTAVYSIVKKDAKKFGSIPRYVESKGQEGKEYTPLPGALTDLLNRPNEYQGQDAFFTLIRSYYKICGESFIWLNRGDTFDMELGELDDEAHSKKPVLEMYVLPSNYMIVVPDPENVYGVLGYILESTVRVPIRKVDVIHWKDINLDFDVASRTHLRGRSPLASGFKTLEQNNSATDAAVRMYQNSGARGVMSEKNAGVRTPTQQSQLTNVFDTKINNIDVKGSIAGLQGDWMYHNIGQTSVDMELLEGKDYSMKELCFLLGMPFEFFDPHTPFAEKQIGQKAWVINEIMPDCKQLDGEMGRVLLKAFGLDKTAAICSDFDDMPELQEDKKTQIEYLMKGPYTVNEIREATGYDEVDDGDEIIIPTGFQTLEDLMAGDGGDEILNSLYNANGSANRSNGNGALPKNKAGAKLPAGKT